MFIKLFSIKKSLQRKQFSSVPANILFKKALIIAHTHPICAKNQTVFMLLTLIFRCLCLAIDALKGWSRGRAQVDGLSVCVLCIYIMWGW